jgi:copper homeostasis protein
MITQPQPTPQLEIAVTSLQDALNAVAGGADSVEISHNLAAGGLTPARDLVRAVLDVLSIPVHVIVRPHAQGFHYTDDDIALMLDDAAHFAHAGVASVVFGAVDSGNHLDIALIQRFAAQIAPTPLTVHRALDTSAQPDESVAVLARIIPRILTSGAASNAWDGREDTRRWVAQYGDQIEFVLSGGIRLDQLPALAAYTRAPVFHIGGAARTDDLVDVNKVRRLHETLHTIS